MRTQAPTVARSLQGFPGNRPNLLPRSPPLPCACESCPKCAPHLSSPYLGQLSWRREEGSQTWARVGPSGFAAPWPGPAGEHKPARGLAQPPERLPSPVSHTQAPAQLRDSAAHCSGEGPVARIYYGMEISQVQTTRPGHKCPLRPAP